jgi:hypothetical protein
LAATPVTVPEGLARALGWCCDASAPRGARAVIVPGGDAAPGGDATLPAPALRLAPNLGVARRLAPGAVVVGSPAAMPVAPGSVGALACLEPFDAVADKEAVVREWRRVTRAGAHVLAVVRGSSGVDAASTWLAYFAVRGFRTAADDAPRRASGELVTLRLVAAPVETSEPRFTAPLPAEDVERLARAVAGRGATDARGPLVAPAGAALPPVPPYDNAAVGAMIFLEQSRAPFFNPSIGRGPAQLAKRFLNVPLAVFGRPQHLFNATVRALFDVCLQLVRQLTQYQGTLRDELTLERATLDRLTREHDALKARVEALEADRARSDGPAGTR